MGVKNLWEILEPCKKKLPLHHLQNKRVCIDLSCWIVQLHTVTKAHSAPREKLYLKTLFHRLRSLIALNCNIILVTDGSIPAIKLSAYRRRLKTGTEDTLDLPKPDEVSSLRRNMGSEFSCMIKEAKSLALALGIPCLDGIEEAEAQCALLDKELLCDGCFTSDSDAFLFGARTVYRDICLGEGGYVLCYEMADIETTLGLGRNSMITLAVLLGSDYSNGIRGIGQESACNILKEIGDNVILKRMASEGLSFIKMSKGTKKQGRGCKSYNNENIFDDKLNGHGNEYEFQTDDQIMQVIDAYLRPKCHLGDSDAVSRVLFVYPFKRTELQHICERFFEWPPEKTDEYILPKVAERDLRRLAYLRLTSSEIETEAPLHEVPVKCSILAIIKPRKVKGKECFEVSWKDFDGLESSVVPADLIRSACPEKIVEFEERKAQKKKQNRKKTKTSKSQTKSLASGLDEKFQDLSLDINSELYVNNTGACSSKENSSSCPILLTNIDLAHQVLTREQQSNSGNNSYSSCARIYATSSISKTEVIDLLSPSPPVRARKISRGKTVESKPTGPVSVIAQPIDVIDLSDTELDVSPEHLRKARELRSFIASIRDEIS